MRALWSGRFKAHVQRREGEEEWGSLGLGLGKERSGSGVPEAEPSEACSAHAYAEWRPEEGH